MSMELNALSKLPPHNIEAEQAVLGSMMLDKEAIIIDDVLSTGKTLLKVAQIVKSKGAKSVSFAFVHLLSESGLDLIKSVSPKKIITTNTLENRYFQLNIVNPLANFLKEDIL